MQNLIYVSESELKADPSAKLWAVIEFLAENDSFKAHPDFFAFWLVYIYDAEVLNGGHLQYFNNHGNDLVVETIEALMEIGADDHAKILESCYKKIQFNPIPAIKSLQEYSDMAQNLSFEEDNQYYDLRPEVLDILDLYYSAKIDLWVGIQA